MTPEVIFIVLNSAVKQRTVCDLAEKLFLSRKRVAIHVADKQEGEMFDKLLWTWKQASFIPHKYIDQLSTPLEEPVVITPQIAATADYDALVLAAPADKEVTDRFPVILDFADKFDQARLLESRERYRLYRSYQYQLVDMQPGEFFAAVLK